MWWMWFVGPALLLVVYVLTGARDKRAEAEVERWRKGFWPRSKEADALVGEAAYRDAPAATGPAPKGASRGTAGAKQVSALPSALKRLIDQRSSGIMSSSLTVPIGRRITPLCVW